MNGRHFAWAAGSDDAAVLTMFLLNGTNAICRAHDSRVKKVGNPFLFLSQQLTIYCSTTHNSKCCFLNNKNNDDDDDDDDIVSIETSRWEHTFNFSRGRELRSSCSSSPARSRKREIVFFLSFSSKLENWTGIL
jgi:hypothetical protein